MLESDKMKKIFLESPTISRKSEALAFLKEHVEYGSEINGTGGMDDCLYGTTYEQWLLEVEQRNNPEYCEKIKKPLSKTFFVIRKEDNRIIGMINIRYKLSDEYISNGYSHIGYDIRPTERRKGYAKASLFLALKEAKILGEERVLLECTVDNTGSNKTILALGGVLEKTELDNYDNTMTNYYWINIDESLDKHFDIYNQYLFDNSYKNRK